MTSLLTALDHQLNLNLVIWIFPLAFLIHDLEEIFTMERFTRENRERFPKFLRNIAAINTTQFTIAVGVLFAITLLASYLATGQQRQVDIFITALALFLVHVFWHIATPIIFRKYTPGLITALLIVMPYSLYAFHRLFGANWIGSDSLSTAILIGVLLFGPLILAVRQIGKLVTH